MQLFCHSLISPGLGAIIHANKCTNGGYMFGFGMPELIVILVIVIVIFGAGRLPEIGSALGKSIKNFKKSSEGKDEIDITPRKDDDKK
jgi:sec-independent protein translocase protein TatA